MRISDWSSDVCSSDLDLVIRGGENIYPSEVEAAILATNLVAEAAVVGQPDAVMGEVPVAFVAVADGGNVDALLPALQAQVDQALARFKRPVTYHFLDSLPRNPIGKIDKPALRRGPEKAAQAVAGESPRTGQDKEIR